VIFPDYWEIAIIGLPISILLLGVWLFRSVKLKRALLRLPVQIVSVQMLSGSSLLLLTYGWVGGFDKTTASPPLYSPDHRRAVRTIDWDYGALGGNTGVRVYSHHGLLVKEVFYGDGRLLRSKTFNG
jgi:hypothetical protein